MHAGSALRGPSSSKPNMIHVVDILHFESRRLSQLTDVQNVLHALPRAGLNQDTLQQSSLSGVFVY